MVDPALGVILRRQVAPFVRTIWARPLTRIVNPANDVVVTGFLSKARKVRGKVAAQAAVPFAH